MADEIFENPSLVAIYDDFDGERTDLPHYESIATSLKAKRVLDIGCGTGCLAIRLSQLGFDVTGIDPAQASVEFARKKENASSVRWLVGDASGAPLEKFDLALMTGNVAQVFTSDEAWIDTLGAVHQRLAPGGHFVFEVRDPAKKAWLDWNRERTYRMVNVDGFGNVEEWCDLLDVSDQLVTFRWTYVFEKEKKTFTSESTLRFRSRHEIESTLRDSGFLVDTVLDAPDRPGKEFVFVTSLKA